jgi:integrase
MAGRQAKVLTPTMQRRLLRHVERSTDPERSRVIILLALKAGLRACEIAGLEWSMVLDARGRIGKTIEVDDRIAKKRGGRRIPLHPDLRRALISYRKLREDGGPIVKSARGGGLKPNSIVNWFVALCAELNLKGCSSHSGRRTFITTAARSISCSGASLRDIQLLAGHRSIETTQSYIDGDTDAQRKLISLL